LAFFADRGVDGWAGGLTVFAVLPHIISQRVWFVAQKPCRAVGMMEGITAKRTAG
jgi:hypothetical protein